MLCVSDGTTHWVKQISFNHALGIKLSVSITAVYAVTQYTSTAVAVKCQGTVSDVLCLSVSNSMSTTPHRWRCTPVMRKRVLKRHNT